MKRKWAVALALAAVIVLAGAQGALATNDIYGPYAGSGAVGAPGTAPADSCALTPIPGDKTTTNWALEVYTFKVTVNPTPKPDGTYSVTPRYSKGHFTTLGGDSPGKCDSDFPGYASSHGSTVSEGVSGTFGGNQHLYVTPGAGGYNPAGSCERDASGQCTLAGFVHGFFGDDATYTVFYYRFVYKSSGLVHNQWITQINTALDTGDIASS